MTPGLDRPLRTLEEAKADIAANVIVMDRRRPTLDDFIHKAQQLAESDCPIEAQRGRETLSLGTVRARIRQMADEQNAERGSGQ